MRLLFAGTPRVALPALELLLESAGHDVVAVLTRPDAVAGRGRHPARSPVAERADAAGLEVLAPPSAKDPGFFARLRELAPDCCPVVAYGGLVPRPALDVPEHGWVNLHFSLLPAWRGAAPVPAAIRAGDEVTGATTFRLVEELDAGPVYGAATERIGPTDTAGALLERLSRTGSRLLADTLDAIEAGTATPRPQPADGASLAPKITTEDARVRWDLPPHLVDRLVRACTPEPGAWTTFRGERVKLGPVTPAPQESGLEPGQVRAGKQAVHVGTANGAVRLGTVQAPGRKPVDAADWSRGAHPGAGEEFV